MTSESKGEGKSKGLSVRGKAEGTLVTSAKQHKLASD